MATLAVITMFGVPTILAVATARAVVLELTKPRRRTVLRLCSRF